LQYKINFRAVNYTEYDSQLLEFEILWVGYCA